MITTTVAVKRESRIKLFFFLGSMLLLFVVIVRTNNFFVSFLAAFVSYCLLVPMVDLLERRGFSRVAATIFPFLLVSICLFVLGRSFAPLLIEQASAFQKKIPEYTVIANQLLKQLEVNVSGYLTPIFSIDLRGQIEPEINQWTKMAFEKLPQYVSNSLTVLVLTPFLAYFMLVDGRDFFRKILSLVPNNLFELSLNLSHQVNTQMGGFIRARLIETIIISVFIWLGLLFLDFPYSLVLALFAGVMNVIPYVGPVFGALPAVVISFGNGGNHTELLWLLTIYGGAQLLDMVLFVPFVVAKIVDLHPVTVVLAILVGSQLMGVLGMIISIPLFSALKVSSVAIYRHFTDFRF